MTTEDYYKTIAVFIHDELAVHEGGIIGGVTFSWDDATRDYVVTVGSRTNNKSGYGPGIVSAIRDFKERHRKDTEG